MLCMKTQETVGTSSETLRILNVTESQGRGQVIFKPSVKKPPSSGPLLRRGSCLVRDQALGWYSPVGVRIVPGLKNINSNNIKKYITSKDIKSNLTLMLVVYCGHTASTPSCLFYLLWQCDGSSRHITCIYLSVNECGSDKVGPPWSCLKSSSVGASISLSCDDPLWAHCQRHCTQ